MWFSQSLCQTVGLACISMRDGYNPAWSQCNKYKLCIRLFCFLLKIILPTISQCFECFGKVFVSDNIIGSGESQPPAIKHLFWSSLLNINHFFLFRHFCACIFPSAFHWCNQAEAFGYNLPISWLCRAHKHLWSPFEIYEICDQFNKSINSNYYSILVSSKTRYIPTSHQIRFYRTCCHSTISSCLHL